MIRAMPASPAASLGVWTHTAAELPGRMPALDRFVLAAAPGSLGHDPRWLGVLQRAFGHDVFALEARIAGHTCGYLPLALVDSLLFGRYLVSLPYLNSNGAMSTSAEVDALLIDRAVALADELSAKHLELRAERRIVHPGLNGELTSKVHMRLPLPKTADELWKGYDTKVRNQIRKGEKNDFAVHWGGLDLLDPFYAVLSTNMRDLGTPIYAKRLFAEILSTFPNGAELCLVKAGERPIACAMLLHGRGITDVPTASSLREFNATCANMLMYRHLLDRAVERGQATFDFGRSTQDGPTFKFKKQWGALPQPAIWQYHRLGGDIGEMRPDNPKYQFLIKLWQKLPVKLTQFVGPPIVRGIP